LKVLLAEIKNCKINVGFSIRNAEDLLDLTQFPNLFR